VVASVIPAPDPATIPLMTAFHQRVAAGASGSQALALAQAELAATGDDEALAAVAGFVCIGGEFQLARQRGGAVPAPPLFSSP
jgi:CHAT domain-containing protein